MQLVSTEGSTDSEKYGRILKLFHCNSYFHSVYFLLSLCALSLAEQGKVKKVKVSSLRRRCRAKQAKTAFLHGPTA